MKRSFLLMLIIASYTYAIAQVSKTVNIAAGNLESSLTADELETVSDLTVTGTIDARDFKTMRDMLPLLEHIDIRNASIVAYSGEDGTRSGSHSYSGNSVPIFSFYNWDTKISKTMLISVQLPNNITEIQQSAFRSLPNLSQINLPPTLLQIRDNAFLRSGELLNINIPASTSNVGFMAFASLNGTIRVDENNAYFSSQDGVLFDKNKTKLIACPTTVSGTYVMPESVNEIREYAFFRCFSITGTMVIPNGVTKIGMYAFAYCSNIEKIIIPSTVTEIRADAFTFCGKLEELHSYATTPVDLSDANLDGVFRGIDKENCKLYVPKSTSGAYANAERWKDFVNIVEIDGTRLSGNKRPVGADQNSSTTVDLYAYTQWTASSNRSWLYCSPASGNYVSTLKIIADVNPGSVERIGTISIAAPGHPARNIEVRQSAGPGLAVLENLEITDRVFSGKSSRCYGAENNIVIAGNGKNVIVENQFIVSFIAGQSIRFLPGFHAQAGSAVNAWISTTGDFCTPMAGGSPLVLAEPVVEKSIEEPEMPDFTEHFTEQSMKVYPNPNNGQFTLSLNGFDGQTRVLMYNTTGQLVYDVNLHEDKLWVELPNVQRGIYFVRAINRGRHFEQKIVVR